MIVAIFTSAGSLTASPAGAAASNQLPELRSGTHINTGMFVGIGGGQMRATTAEPLFES